MHASLASVRVVRGRCIVARNIAVGVVSVKNDLSPENGSTSTAIQPRTRKHKAYPSFDDTWKNTLVPTASSSQHSTSIVQYLHQAHCIAGDSASSSQMLSIPQ